MEMERSGRARRIGAARRIEVFVLGWLAAAFLWPFSAAHAQESIPLMAVTVGPGRSICANPVRVRTVATVETRIATPTPISMAPILTVTSTSLDGFVRNLVLQTPLSAGPTAPRTFFTLDRAIFPSIVSGGSVTACVMNPATNPGAINLILVLRGDGV
jgi:hypothetical protein